MSATGTPTPNLGLRIPLGTDPASVDDINYNSNALDTIIGDVGETPVAGQLGAANNRISAVQAGLAIVCNGNTHAAIESGQFAYVKNHGTLAEGLYRNNTGSTIAANATLSSSNLTADSSGGLNTVYDALNSNLTKIGNCTIINCASLTQLKDGLKTVLNSMLDGDCVPIEIRPTFSDSIFGNGGKYQGHLFRTDGYYNMNAIVMTSSVPDIITIQYYSGTDIWNIKYVSPDDITAIKNQLASYVSTTTGSTYSGDGVASLGSVKFDIPITTPAGYSAIAVKEIVSTAGTFVWSVRNISNTTVKVIGINTSDTVKAPETISITVITRRNNL